METILFFLFLLRIASVVADVSSFKLDVCPWAYVNSTGGTIQLVATCAIGDGPDQYQTSTLDLDKCLTNYDGALYDINVTFAYPGPFSKTCIHCGLWGDGDYYFACACYRRDQDLPFAAASMNLNEAVTIENGTLYCHGMPGDVKPYSESATPKMIPPDLSTTTTVTVDQVIANNITVTAPPTTVFTTSVSYPAPSSVTVLETTTKKVTKDHKVTKFKTATETAQVTKTVAFTLLPTETNVVTADLHTTVVASLSTVHR
ncbi:hypothetical protein M426DRAFT_7372 [Hypoxylon sp. CI-4A]|nr:hypothetical protein M426DRAFT_7372 [Hypoxylon sp. CI-4A]